METIIVTDSCCDLPYDYIMDNQIEMISLSVIIGDDEEKDQLAKTGEYENFYQGILDGNMPKTSQINAHEFKEVFMRYAKEGKGILYIGFSSALSGCVNSARLAVEEVKEEIPDARIYIVDSNCASMGQGMLVDLAVKQRKEGKTVEEITEYVEVKKQHIHHWFTVADLNHLFRGGRVSKTAATFGTLLQVKPILQVDKEGKLVAVEKVKGRKKSLKALVEKVKEHIIDPTEQIVFISHGGALKEAEEVKEAILAECQVKEVWINYIGATIGSHAGPGTIGVFFVGQPR